MNETRRPCLAEEQLQRRSSADISFGALFLALRNIEQAIVSKAARENWQAEEGSLTIGRSETHEWQEQRHRGADESDRGDVGERHPPRKGCVQHPSR